MQYLIIKNMNLKYNLNKKYQRTLATTEAERLASQHALGKLGAQERIDILLDHNTFQEISFPESNGSEPTAPLDAVIIGSGKINGRTVFIFSQNFQIMGGTISHQVGMKIALLLKTAKEQKAPVIGIYDSGGARIQDGVSALAGVGEILFHNIECSGIVPLIAVVVGPCAGGAAYSPALCDFVFCVDTISKMYITGPDAVKSVTHETVDPDDLGGTKVLSQKSGVAHFCYENELQCFSEVKRLLEYLPQSCTDQSMPIEARDNNYSDDLLSIIPEDDHIPYDMKRLIESVVDNNSFMEVQPLFAPNIICGFARLKGNTIGVVAQQPNILAGAIDVNASVKASRFVRFCDAFNTPIITIVDSPGFLPGTEQEHKGIIRHGAKLVFAYAEATVPKISLITRKAYGGAYIAMGSRHIGGDITFVWQKAKIAVMGAEPAVNIMFRKEIACSANPDATRQSLIEEYAQTLELCQDNKPEFIDRIISPDQTRQTLSHALRLLNSKYKLPLQKKHVNIPL